MGAAELFKGAEDVARFIRSLEGLLAIKDALTDTASLVQAAQEAEASAAKFRSEALLAKTELENVQAEADRLFAAGKEKYEAAVKDAEAIVEKAKVDAQAIEDEAKGRADRALDRARADLADINRQIEDAAKRREGIGAEIASGEARLAEIKGQIDALVAKLGG